MSCRFPKALVRSSFGKQCMMVTTIHIQCFKMIYTPILCKTFVVCSVISFRKHLVGLWSSFLLLSELLSIYSLWYKVKIDPVKFWWQWFHKLEKVWNAKTFLTVFEKHTHDFLVYYGQWDEVENFDSYILLMVWWENRHLKWYASMFHSS